MSSVNVSSVPPFLELSAFAQALGSRWKWESRLPAPDLGEGAPYRGARACVLSFRKDALNRLRKSFSLMWWDFV